MISGPHFGLRISARPDLQRGDPRRQLVDQAIGSLLANWDGDGDGHAALAGGAVAGAHQGIDGLVHVGIGHDDHVILGTTQRLHPFAVGSAGRIDIFGDRR